MDNVSLSREPRRSDKRSRNPVAGRARGACEHCGGPTARLQDTFCCEGCRHVHELLRGQGLARYYELRSGAGVPVLDQARGLRDEAWIEVEVARLSGQQGLAILDLDVEGLHCTGCVWLIEEIFRRTGAAGKVTVNAALGSVELTVDAGFPLRAFYERLLELGYRLGPHRKDTKRASDDLVWRIGVCVAIAMNAMIFAIARYAGLEGGTLESVFLWLELGLSVAAFLVGGIVFVRAALRGLARGIVHLDLPIAVGLLLGYAGSFAAVVAGRADGSYLDTLIVFTTLMLVGRFLRERVLEKNRAQLLDDTGIEGVLCRRLAGARVEVVPVSAIVANDRLVVAPGDVVPVGATTTEEASFSFDWITGESEPRTFQAGASVTAGAANASGRATVAVATEPFSQSRLLRLLRAPRPAARYGEAPSPFEAKVSRLWVPLVLAAAATGFALFALRGEGMERALGVAVAILVVTCPCAFGIATPIAHELVLGGLRKRGLLVRSATFLERAVSVRRVVFDKTGTLTSGELRLVDDGAIATLDARERGVLYNLVARSSHPKSAAIRAALDTTDVAFDASLSVVELPSKGLELETDGHRYRLTAAADSSSSDVALTRDGHPIATFHTVEQLRPDAADEVRGLVCDGNDVWMATGDVESRAAAIAEACGIAGDHVLARQTPEQKAAFVAKVDRGDTLMIGDGVNDGPAVQAAHCSGTPSAGRAFLAARSDFYLLSPGLGPVRKGLAAAHALRRALRRSVAWAVTYNVFALGLAYAGLMSPLLCALLMPASSLVSIAMVVRSLGRKGPVWRS